MRQRLLGRRKAPRGRRGEYVGRRQPPALRVGLSRRAGGALLARTVQRHRGPNPKRSHLAWARPQGTGEAERPGEGRGEGHARVRASKTSSQPWLRMTLPLRWPHRSALTRAWLSCCVSRRGSWISVKCVPIRKTTGEFRRIHFMHSFVFGSPRLHDLMNPANSRLAPATARYPCWIPPSSPWSKMITCSRSQAARAGGAGAAPARQARAAGQPCRGRSAGGRTGQPSRDP